MQPLIKTGFLNIRFKDLVEIGEKCSHETNYFDKIKQSSLMSDDETPPIRIAWAAVSGLTKASFLKTQSSCLSPR